MGFTDRAGGGGFFEKVFPTSFRIPGAVLTILLGGTAYYTFSTSAFSPSTDLGATLGDATHRFGGLYVGRDSIGSTVETAPVNVVRNGTAALVGATVQQSPLIVWEGSAWDVDDAVSRKAQIGILALPVSGNTVAVTTAFYKRVETAPGVWAGWSSPFSFTDAGTTYAAAGNYTGDITVTGNDILSSTAAAATVFNGSATSVAIAGAGDLIASGGSGSTGCTLTGATGDWACSGDLSAAGGYRARGAITYNASNIQASQTDGIMIGSSVAYNLDYFIRAGSVVGIYVICNANVSGSAIVFDVITSAGSHLITNALTIAVGSASGYAAFAKDTYAVAAGAGVRVAYTTDGSWDVLTTDCSAWLDLEF